MITVEGKNGIVAKVLAHSTSKAGKELITWEVCYPRLILAEVNTHRMMSKNSFSSRAVPFQKMLAQLTGEPVRFGANQGGMQDKGEDYDALISWPEDQVREDGCIWEGKFGPRTMWKTAKKLAIAVAKAFYEAGYHKQVYNRLLEPFQMMKTVISATEDDNFFWLRDDDAADPTLRELARVMRESKEASTPTLLKAGQWHLPYVDVEFETGKGEDGQQIFFIKNEGEGAGVTYLTLEEAIKVSCARCAAVSYRNEGYGLEKSLELYERLVGDEKKHASALEHCATPIREYGYYEGVFGRYESNRAFVPFTWEEGITHVDRRGRLWSGNFMGWIQHRKLVKGENYEAD